MGTIRVGTIVDEAGTGAPAATFGITGVLQRYFNGQQGSGTWSTTSTSFADPSGGTNTLSNTVSSGLTVTAAASNVAGIKWTPSVSTAVYLVSVSGTMRNLIGVTQALLKLTDGTVDVVFTYCQGSAAADEVPFILHGIYKPNTASEVTLKIQAKTDTGGTTELKAGTGGLSNFTWSVIQIV